MKTKPAAKSPASAFEAQLREQLYEQASQQIRPFSLTSLLTSAAGLGLITAVVFLFWFTQRQINQPQPVAPVLPSIGSEALANARATALERLQIEDFKPIGGQLLILLDVQIEPISVAEGLDLLGTYAVADHEGSNIILAEMPLEQEGEAWLVQGWGIWKEFDSENKLYRFGAALVDQESGQLIIAGASSHHFIDSQPQLTLSLVDYPARVEPYLLQNEDGSRLWLVHTDEFLRVFDAQAPYLDAVRERCVISWEVVNGRFIDPCSGDEWELEGVINIAASSEMWSREKLDQYYVTKEDDQLTIWLSFVEEAIQ